MWPLESLKKLDHLVGLSKTRTPEHLKYLLNHWPEYPVLTLDLKLGQPRHVQIGRERYTWTFLIGGKVVMEIGFLKMKYYCDYM